MNASENAPIKIFLDTCVLLDFLIKERKNEVSKFLLAELDIKSKAGVYSSFALLELKDQYYAYSDVRIKLLHGDTPDEIIRSRQTRRIKKEDRERDDIEINEFLDRNQRKLLISTSNENEIWKTAFELMTLVNITAPDALQLSYAIFSQCDIFISKDEGLIAAIGELQEKFKLIPIHYKTDTQITTFQTLFSEALTKLSPAPVSIREEVGEQLIRDFSSMLATSSFNAEEYEKKILGHSEDAGGPG